MTSSRVSALLILLVIVCGPILLVIVCGPILCPCYLYLKNPPKAGNNRHFMSKYYLRLSMLPAYQTALCVLIPVQCRLRGKCITVNKSRVQVNCQLINFIQFLDNKRSEAAYIVFQTVKILTTHTCKICSPVFVYTLMLLVIRYPTRDKSWNQKAPTKPLDHMAIGLVSS